MFNHDVTFLRIITKPVPVHDEIKRWVHHNYHLVPRSILPFTTGFSAMLVAMNLVFFWHPSSLSSINLLDKCSFQLGAFLFLASLFTWFVTVVREAAMCYHTPEVIRGLRYGMLLFIVSEIMFFFAFFWGFFHISLSPSSAIGCVWPPQGIQPISPLSLPLVNTLLLLASGVTLTFAHHDLLTSRPLRTVNPPYRPRFMYFKDQKAVKNMPLPVSPRFVRLMYATILLGVTFLACQALEYRYGITFSWRDSIYGTFFFVITGFHGVHVIIGVLFLMFCLARTFKYPTIWGMIAHVVTPYKVVYWRGHIFDRLLRTKYPRWWIDLLPSFDRSQHVGFEAAAWYWHFVDVVWLFLYISIYWWGSVAY